MISENKTIRQIKEHIERIAEYKNPYLILRAFKSLPDPPGQHTSDLEVKVLTIGRAPLIKALADKKYAPAATLILEYAQKVRLTSEVISCIEALGILEYKDARNFIEQKRNHYESWYNRYKYHRAAKGVDIILQGISKSNKALERLSGVRE